jgi:hypothetical protein
MPPISRLPLLALPQRPNWLTGGMLRLGLLSAFVVAVGMVPGRLTVERAWWVVGIGGALILLGLGLFLLATRRLTAQGPFEYATVAVLHLLRRTGLPLLGLVLFLIWTLVYVGLWAFRPDGAFQGLEPSPRFADFFYYAVSTAFISPPGDIFASSRGARSATMIEMLTAFALLTAYLSSFVDWQRRDPTDPPPPAQPRAS